MRLRWLAVGMATLTGALALAALALGGGKLGGVDGREPALSLFDVVELTSLLATAAVALVVALRRPASPIGWIFSAYALGAAAYEAAGGYAIRAIVIAPGSLPGGDWAAWFRQWADRPLSALSLLAFLLFPTGRLASARWRPALAMPVLVVLGFTARAFVPGPLGFLGVPNPVGVAWVPSFIEDGVLGGIPLGLGSVLAAAEIRARYHLAGPSERGQIKWLAIPLAGLIIAIVATVATLVAGVPIADGVSGALITGFFGLVQTAIPVCMAIAIVRHRLLDIDLLINRALVYGTTTAAVALTFFVGIILLQAVLSPITAGSDVAVAVSTLACLALFQPLRRRMQEAIDRRFYRSRYDAARTLDAFAVRMRDQVALEAVRADLLDAARDTVQPAHASLWLRR